MNNYSVTIFIDDGLTIGVGVPLKTKTTLRRSQWLVLSLITGDRHFDVRMMIVDLEYPIYSKKVTLAVMAKVMDEKSIPESKIIRRFKHEINKGLIKHRWKIEPLRTVD